MLTGARTTFGHVTASLTRTVKMISGDNRDVTGSLAAVLGARPGLVTGAQIEAADDARLRELVMGHDLFAEVEPMHKVAILTALKRAGETVGFLGDGINDAAALHVADVGMSVDSAANIAKEAAAIVLLEKNLAVIAAGVRPGRHTFANTLKYVRVAASANLGNILSMVIAAAALPFLPVLPAQILLQNTAPVEVTFLGMHGSAPLALMLLIAGVGFGIVTLISAACASDSSSGASAQPRGLALRPPARRRAVAPRPSCSFGR